MARNPSTSVAYTPNLSPLHPRVFAILLRSRTIKIGTYNWLALFMKSIVPTVVTEVAYVTDTIQKLLKSQISLFVCGLQSVSKVFQASCAFFPYTLS